MSAYIETINRLLVEKTGKRACELEYMELPDEDKRYNAKLSIGNIHLVSGRIKTKRKAACQVHEFLNISIP